MQFISVCAIFCSFYSYCAIVNAIPFELNANNTINPNVTFLDVDEFDNKRITRNTTAENMILVQPEDEDEAVDGLIKRFERLYPIEDWITHGYFEKPYLKDINAHWLRFAPQLPSRHYALALGYAIIMCCGVCGNFIVICLFLRCKGLRTPANILVFNLACSDLLMMLKMPIFIYNSLHLGPALGDYVCRLYGFVGGLSGTCSICTITAISLDRYYVVKYPLKNRFSSMRAKSCVLFAWAYSSCFSCIPLLDIGYGKYSPEGFLTSCSFDYLTNNTSANNFIWLFFIGAFVLPVCLITYFYSSILRVVVHKQRTKPAHKLTGRESQRHMKLEDKRKQELRVTLVVFSIIVLWILAWTPYAIVALMGICGYHQWITPLASMIPALFCKTASCVDPFIYALTHPKFKDELRYVCCTRKRRGSSTRRHLTVISNMSSRNFTQSPDDEHSPLRKLSSSKDLNVFQGCRQGTGRNRRFWWHKSSWRQSRSRRCSQQSSNANVLDRKDSFRKQDDDCVEEFALKDIKINEYM